MLHHIKIIFYIVFAMSSLNASFKDGQNIIKQKCLTCHIEYIDMELYKKNFRDSKNKLLNLKAPTFNRIVYKILDSNKQIGTSYDDNDIRKEMISDYLKEALEKPNYGNSLFGKGSRKYYNLMPSLKGEVNNQEYKNLVDYIWEYKNNIKPKKIKKVEKNLSYYTNSQILDKANKENKMIIIEAASKNCHYCKKMRKEVLSLKEVKDVMYQNYIFIESYIDNNKLPLNLDKKFPKVTPTFFFLDQKGTLLKIYPGSWNKNDFLKLLKEHTK